MTIDPTPLFSNARKAFQAWSMTAFEERCAILRQYASALESAKQSLAETIAREIGKPLPESLGEVGAMIGKVEISIHAYEQRCAEFTGGPSVTRFRPHGVLVVLGPYNFPGHLPNGHIVPALLAGNTVIFKPSEYAPKTAEAMLAIWRETPLPKGALQLIQGGPEVAKTLTAHPEVDGVLFTGSARTGKLLARQFAETPGKVLALEMGGNNPLIVDTPNIADLEQAAKTTVESAFISAGQRCTCARRLIVINSEKASDFFDTLVLQASGLSIGDPFADPPPFMGPLAHPTFAEAVLTAQADLLKAGATPLLPAKALDLGKAYVSPGILEVTGLTNLPDEEVFGPLLQVIRVNGLDDAIRIANQTRYGLASGILTDSRDRYQHAYQRLRAGIINWNAPLTGASSAAPFGGIGDSGNLRPSAFFAADYCAYPVASIERGE
ncbi:succinylglutamate-semialdehyde dehydrogenase [Puniceicoccales bacterium CK1056]|uniref:Succinylglutamate-semialdehyde dehydrogenase n=1 Tax=Oceanipulchritudo coccoides TaxID=2706888 RepID=A0A6B2M470_9BACT|nr:succinylglutamate-semialdehyde dehydrogenase [Oceanipulchritudo coccoides]NDV63019.1 succinylglutamate-semialdehyde dehydrogenase [Oceanipulchritudo coccoides]